MVDSNSSLLALHISPISALNPDNKIVRIDSLDWVMYHSVLYTSKALMKVVSKVKLEWVEEKMKLFKKLETVNLDGSNDKSSDANKDDSDSKQKGTGIDKDNENTIDDVMDDEEEKRRKKLEAIEAARQRALNRRLLNPDS